MVLTDQRKQDQRKQDRLNLHWGGAVVLTLLLLACAVITYMSQSPLGWSGGADGEIPQPQHVENHRLNLHWGGAVVLTIGEGSR